MSRVLVAVVTLAFCFATTLYAAHVHETTGKKSAVTHCEVCLQLSGTASSPPPPSLAGFVPLITFEAAAGRVRSFITVHRARAHRSRAPPASSL
jgi:hypothetical protein